MKRLTRSLIPPLTHRLCRALGLFSLCATTAFAATPDQERRAQDREAIHERMLRYGITREDVKAITASWGGRGGARISDRHQNATSYSEYGEILADRVLKSGEHYRFEVDQYIVTMQVPDAPHGSPWIVPYADTRSDPERDAILRKSPDGLQLANLSWYYGTGIWPLFIGWQGQLTMELRYLAVSAESKTLETHASPESLRQRSQSLIESRVPAPAEVEEAIRKRRILNSAGNQIYLDAEPVVINGRIWVRTALNSSYGRLYSYRTVLRPDRWLYLRFSLPEYDYNANPDRATYPAALQRAFADMEAMLASLRVATLNDDGVSDPFVVERVEAAPLPRREKLPTAP